METPIYKRHGLKWTISEIMRLQREYELMGLSIEEIAFLHYRSERAICCRIELEGFSCDLEDAK
jgi:hypothetical protein